MNEYHKSCGAAIIHDNKILLIKDSANNWQFPIGHIEEGETEEQTAVREVKEEVGLSITIVPGFREIIKFHYHEGEKHIDKEIVIFLAKTNDAKAVPNNEIKEYKWFTREEALKAVKYDDLKRIITNAYG